MNIIPTTYFQGTDYYNKCLKNYSDMGVEYLRINCTRVSIDEYIYQLNEINKNSIKYNGKRFKFLLDLPIPRSKPRIMFKWPVPTERVAKSIGGDNNYFRIVKGEIVYIVKKFDIIDDLLQFEINDFSFFDEVNTGDTIFICENTLALKVVGKHNDYITLIAKNNGFISYNKAVHTGSVSCVENNEYDTFKPLINAFNPEIIALSFVESGRDIVEFRKRYSINNSKILAKVESPKAIENINDIINEADMIMIGRGDLFINSKYEDFAFYIDRVLKINKNRLPIYIATGILESLKPNHYEPTKSELTEIFYYLHQNISGFIFTFGTSQDIKVFNNACSIINDMEKNFKNTIL